MRIEWLDECVSTNTQVTEYPLSEEGVIVAVRQARRQISRS